MHAGACAHVYEGLRSSRGSFFNGSPYYWDRVSHWTWASLIWLDCLASKTQESSHLWHICQFIAHFSIWASTEAHVATFVFYASARGAPGVSCLHSKHLTYLLSHLSTPLYHFTFFPMFLSRYRYQEKQKRIFFYIHLRARKSGKCRKMEEEVS